MQKGNLQEEQHTLRDSINWVYLLMRLHATCFYPFLRYGAGAEAYGINAVLALIMMLFWASAQGSGGMLLFVGLWLVALVMQRVMTFRRRRTHIVHSRYMGTSWPARLIPFTSEQTAAATEPLLCFVVGICIAPVSESLAIFVMLGVVSLLVTYAFQAEADRREIQAMRDAQIEQQWRAERFRNQG